MLVTLNPCWGMRAKKHKFSDTKIQIFVAFAKFFMATTIKKQQSNSAELLLCYSLWLSAIG